MYDKKKGIFQVLVIVLMILLMVSAFVLLFSGHYGVALVLFGIWMALLSSIWIGTKNLV
ncbi:hypothetical protein LG296_21100 (plasmid) [Ureibacillus chungkukjangi]|uniref:hypothetical protein n=1 Tax=Ureibacillus chungkukjangi TaxID=1202712 RepID=UPI00187D3E83|nr:hypothetical protein [Ureibacillus chungkukjangi]MCM3390623.1 hypothetical protein [Ureibacillus chungkukjangi]